MHYSHKSFDSTLNPYMKNSIQNNPYEDQFHNYSNQKIYGESNEVIETQNYEQIESNPNNNNLQNDTNEHDNKQIENEVTRLPELSRNEQKQSRLQSSSNSGRHKNGNNSINLNSYELAKYFDCLKRRDPILSQIKIPELEHNNPEIKHGNAYDCKPNTAQVLREMHEIHAKAFTDHHIQWKNKYPRPFK